MIVDTLEQAWRVWADLGAELSESQWQRQTRLPGWTVKDVYAHYSPFPGAVQACLRKPRLIEPLTHTSAGALLADMQQPGVQGERIARVLRDTAVKRAAETPSEDLIREFSEVGKGLVADLREADWQREQPLSYGGFAVLTWQEGLRLVVLEAVVHYCDMADALGWELPGPMAGDPLRETVCLLAEAADPIALIDVATGRTSEQVFPVMH